MNWKWMILAALLLPACTPVSPTSKEAPDSLSIMFSDSLDGWPSTGTLRKLGVTDNAAPASDFLRHKRPQDFGTMLEKGGWICSSEGTRLPCLFAYESDPGKAHPLSEPYEMAVIVKQDADGTIHSDNPFVEVRGKLTAGALRPSKGLIRGNYYDVPRSLVNLNDVSVYAYKDSASGKIRALTIPRG